MVHPLQSSQTCLGIHREAVLALSDGVHQPGAVSIRGIISISGSDLDYGGACETEEAGDRLKSLRFKLVHKRSESDTPLKIDRVNIKCIHLQD